MTSAAQQQHTHHAHITAALELARLGLKTAVAALPACTDALNTLAAELAEIVGEANVLVVPTDVTDLAAMQRLCDTVYEHWSEAGVLLNNAGISGAPRGTSWDGLANWHTVFAVNLFGALNVQQTFVPSMLH